MEEYPEQLAEPTTLREKIEAHLVSVGYEPSDSNDPFTLWVSPKGLSCSVEWAVRVCLQDESCDDGLRRLLRARP